MLDQTDKGFLDELEAKIYTAQKRDSEQQTADIISKLEDIKDSLPKTPDLSETNQLLVELIDEMKKPWQVELKLK